MPCFGNKPVNQTEAKIPGSETQTLNNQNDLRQKMLSSNDPSSQVFLPEVPGLIRGKSQQTGNGIADQVGGDNNDNPTERLYAMLLKLLNLNR